MASCLQPCASHMLHKKHRVQVQHRVCFKPVAISRPGHTRQVLQQRCRSSALDRQQETPQQPSLLSQLLQRVPAAALLPLSIAGAAAAADISADDAAAYAAVAVDSSDPKDLTITVLAGVVFLLLVVVSLGVSCACSSRVFVLRGCGCRNYGVPGWRARLAWRV